MSRKFKTCAVCGGKIPVRVKIDGKYRNLQNRTKCLHCLPFGQSPYRKKSPEEKRAYGAEKARRWYRKEREKLGRDPMQARSETRKKEILSLVGGKCQFCDYGRCLRNMAFHHVNEEEKCFPLSSREFQFSWKKLIKELKKCVVACHNCHGEIHEGLIGHNLVEEKNKIFMEKMDEFAPNGC